MKSLAFILTLAGVGCAFQPSAEVQTLRFPPLSLSADWVREPQLGLGKRVKATRTLVGTGGKSIAAKDSISLPSEAPSTLYLAVEVPTALLTSPVEFVRSRLSFGEEAFDVVTSLVSEDAQSPDTHRLMLQVIGLNAVYPKDQSREGTLELRAYGRSLLLAEVTVKLRTPPSHLDLRYLSLREWIAERADTKSVFDRPELLNRHFNLLQVLRITNREGQRVEIQTPRRPVAKLKQWVNSLVHQDLGCSFRVNESPQWNTYSDEVLILPMDSQFLSRISDAYGEANEKSQVKDQMALRIEAGAAADFGIYAVGQGADEWMTRGPSVPDLREIRVPNDCYSVCEETECWGGRGDVMGRLRRHLTLASFHSPRPSAGFRRSPIRLASCHCSIWSKRRNEAAATVGTNRGPVLLEVDQASSDWPVRFGDFDFSTDGEARLTRFLSGSAEMLWK